MRRGAKPGKAKIVAKQPRARTSPKDEASKRHDLEKRLAESLEREKAKDRALTEALEQQTATAEILRVISRSPTDVQPVFDTILANAARLCDAHRGALLLFRDGVFETGAELGTPLGLSDARKTPYRPEPHSHSLLARIVVERRAIFVPDLRVHRAYEEREPRTVAAVELAGSRSLLAVPLLNEDVLIGVITIHRPEPGPFSEEHISLLQTFADQAVIAIENVRLFNETKEALEQQTATSEILRVITTSPTDLEPVLNTVVASAARFCGAHDAVLFQPEAGRLRAVAHHGPIPSRLGGRHSVEITPGTVRGRAFLERRTIHVADLQAETDEFPAGSADARERGHRTILSVPLLREGAAIGVIHLRRTEVDPFTDKQIALLQTFADQAVIAIENVRLFNELEGRNRDLTATSEILRVISSSPTDVQPVFDMIVRSAVRLCDGLFSGLMQFDGELLHHVAQQNFSPEALEEVHRVFPARPTRALFTGRAILERAVVHIPDVEVDPEFQQQALSRAIGFRSGLWVPMLREGNPIGVIVVTRAEAGPFSDSEIELLKTFADQAVIAIENVRLFTELQAKNQALTEAHAQVTEALEQQTATAEILRVISQSQTDVQPVFETIVRSAARLCNAPVAGVFLTDGRMVHHLANYGTSPEALAVTRSWYPRPVEMDSTPGMAILTRSVVQVPDIEDPSALELVRQIGRGLGFRSSVGVPMLREGDAVGAIIVNRREPGRFSDAEVELLKTFADQAVIAVENVRLFTELQASNRELTTALDTQTATSDILRVISRSQTDVQPVFDAIVASAVRLLQGNACTLSRIEGDQIALAAMTSIDDAGDASQRARFPMSIHSEEDHAQAVRSRAPLNSTDAHSDPRLPETQHASARLRGYRSLVVVPLVRHDEAVGALGVARPEPGGFTDDEIALLRTFADQAVIAIENARLLTELQARTQELTRSVEQLTALGDVGRAVSSSLDLDTVLTTIVGRAVQLSGTDGGTIFEYDEGTEEFVPRATLNADESQSAMLRGTRLRRGEGAVGQMAVTREPLQIPDIAAKGAYESRLRGALLEAGTRAVLAIPLLHEERIVGGLVVTRRTPGEFTAEVVEILRTFATQSALAIQNARLFHEIERKSRELEVASQHKSEFLANMSHELRTPLNAIIGFSEVLVDRMFGELTEKQDEYLKDIYASGQHLLSLINDILDLSKIEAGRMELEVTDFDLPSAIDNALILVRERASRRGIRLGNTIDERLGRIVGDERKVKQVLLNLLSNALKFTPEGGRIDVSAGVNDGVAEIAVADTGVGIAPEDQEAVFEEFRQVGTADRKADGTGLGLALSRKFIELHGGRIRVKSQLGAGSTFTFTLPLHR